MSPHTEILTILWVDKIHKEDSGTEVVIYMDMKGILLDDFDE